MLDDPDIEAALERLQPYARSIVARAEEFALRIHADELGPEHLLCTLMADDECAAHAAVLHAFADPETIGSEALAMASGIMVSGSAASLPFSPGGVRALQGARRLAVDRRDDAIERGHLLHAAAAALPADAIEDLQSAGWSDDELTAHLGRGDAAAPVTEEGSLFRFFTEDAKRSLSTSARTARQDSADAIGPAHVVVACLGDDAALVAACRVSLPRARVVLRERMRDESAVEPRQIGPDDALLELMAGLGHGAGSLGLLARFHSGATEELNQLLARHRITPALVERVQNAFEDPPAGEARSGPRQVST